MPLDSVPLPYSPARAPGTPREFEAGWGVGSGCCGSPSLACCLPPQVPHTADHSTRGTRPLQCAGLGVLERVHAMLPPRQLPSLPWEGGLGCGSISAVGAAAAQLPPLWHCPLCTSDHAHPSAKGHLCFRSMQSWLDGTFAGALHH